MCSELEERELESRSLEYIGLHGLVKCDFDDACDCCSNPTGGSWASLIHIPEGNTEAEYYICWECLKARAALDWCEICGHSTGEGIRVCEECERWQELIEESDSED